MFKQLCPNCKDSFERVESRTKVISYGRFFRKSDKKYIRRFKCLKCLRHFSSASLDRCYWQRKRHYNSTIMGLLASGNTQRRTAILLGINRKTVARKLIFIGNLAIDVIKTDNRYYKKVHSFEFDDLETYEHTKCKPLSVTLAVETKTRRILGFSVSRMPAKGRLAVKALKKYGRRPDERSFGRKRLFSEIKNCIAPGALIKSDQNPHYVKDVRRYFPDSVHIAYKGRKPCDSGLGELKEGIFDPIFSLNHTFAKLRSDISRLIRETWTTTKKPDRLYLHIAIMAFFHNKMLNQR